MFIANYADIKIFTIWKNQSDINMTLNIYDKSRNTFFTNTFLMKIQYN